MLLNTEISSNILQSEFLWHKQGKWTRFDVSGVEADVLGGGLNVSPSSGPNPTA